MMIPNRMYEFTPPSGGPPIKINALQEYSSGQSRKVEVYTMDMPANHAARVGGHVEFANWKLMISALARWFCEGNERDAADRVILTWSEQAPL